MEILDKVPEGAKLINAAQTIPVGREPAPLSQFLPPSKGPVEFEMPDGMRITLEKPKNTNYLMREILKDVAFISPYLMEREQLRVRALLAVTHIDGQAQAQPTNQISYNALEQKLGDDVADFVLLAYLKNWPPVDDGQLNFIKKS